MFNDSVRFLHGSFLRDNRSRWGMEFPTRSSAPPEASCRPHFPKLRTFALLYMGQHCSTTTNASNRSATYQIKETQNRKGNEEPIEVILGQRVGVSIYVKSLQIQLPVPKQHTWKRPQGIVEVGCLSQVDMLYQRWLRNEDAEDIQSHHESEPKDSSTSDRHHPVQLGLRRPPVPTGD